MSISESERNKLLISGGIAGAATPFLLKYVIVPILNMIGQFTPEVSAKLANPTLAINIRESLTGINAGLSGWLMQSLGIAITENIFIQLIMGAVGGALLFLLGGYLADAIGFLGMKTVVSKTAIVIFIGNIAAGLILGLMAIPTTIDITLVNVLFAFGINAGILAWVYSLIDEKGRIGLIPF